MRISARLALAVGLLVVLGAYALVSRWYGTALGGRAASVATAELSVTSGADRGPGSLREALLTAAAASGGVKVIVRTARIAVVTPLPPLVNPHGLSIAIASGNAELDAHELGKVPVLDVDAAHVSIVGLGIRNCPGTAILVRAGDFRLTGASIGQCDVGIDVAEDVRGIELSHNSFSRNRLSVRFAGSGTGTLVVANRFASETDAAVWAVRGKSDSRDPAAIEVRDNRFSDARIGVVVGNVAMRLEHNLFTNAREAAIHVLGAGASVRENRISGGTGMGIVSESATAATIADNEIDHLDAYGIMVRRSANTLVRSNQLHNCGYGLAFVLGDAGSPSTAADNLIFAIRYDGIDVVGDSPILRHNRLRQVQALPLHVEDYRPPGGAPVHAHPFLDGNDWGNEAAAGAASGAAPRPGAVSSR